MGKEKQKKEIKTYDSLASASEKWKKLRTAPQDVVKLGLREAGRRDACWVWGAKQLTGVELGSPALLLLLTLTETNSWLWKRKQKCNLNVQQANKSFNGLECKFEPDLLFLNAQNLIHSL